MKKTVYAVVTFIIVLILAGYSMKSNAQELDQYFQAGIGQSVANSHLKTGEVGFHVNNWEFQATLMEEGSTKNGFQDQSQIYSVSYVTEPNWGVHGVDPYLRLGLSYNTESELVGDTNFRLGVGMNFNDVWRVEYSHHSSAGIHQTNSGIDYLTVSYLFDPFW